MSYIIRRVAGHELNEGFSLIWRTFSEFIAPSYTQEAVENFKANIIDNMEYRDKFISGQEVMYGAFQNEKIAGVFSVRKNEFISCVFVDKIHHRKGIARQLFNEVMKDLKAKGVKRVRLNSSHYAIPFYHSLGFKDLGEEQVYQGILFTPMELWI